jgi:hypothetical protein
VDYLSGAQGLGRSLDQRGALVDEAGVDLHEVRACRDLGRASAALSTPPTPMIG